MARTPFGESKVWTEEEIAEYYAKHYANQPSVIKAAKEAIGRQTAAYTDMLGCQQGIIDELEEWRQTGDKRLLQKAEEFRAHAEQEGAVVEAEARRYENVIGAPMDLVAEIRVNVHKAHALLEQIDLLLPTP